LIASSVRPFLRAGLYVFLEELQGVRSAEFPDKADSLRNAKSQAELGEIFKGIIGETEKHSDETKVNYKVYEDKLKNIRLETLRVIRLQKINTNTPGLIQP
jgi:hypothetical protein